MIKSMTGFGRGVYTSEKYEFTVEMKSVNHRFLDLNIRMPRTLIAVEDKIRKIISSKLSRGKVDIFITQEGFGKSSSKVVLDTTLADSYLECLNEIKTRYSLKEEPSLGLISKFPDVLTVKSKEEDIDELFVALRIALEDAVTNMLEMRGNEGEKLREDLLLKLSTIEESVKEIEAIAPTSVIAYKTKLEERLKELSKGIDLDETRTYQEVAIFADKCCIDEEVVRLASHIEQMRNTLDKGGSIGRKLDFIIQEINRETNTIASKSTDVKISTYTISIKNEVEKIREQIQNIE